MRGENFIFIISLPRSGSTLLQKILASHSQFHSTGEPWVLLPLLHSKFPDLFTIPDKEIYDGSWAKTPLKSFLSEVNNLDEIFKQSGAVFYESAVNSILNDKKKIYFIDKTPRYYFIIDDIIKYFPKSKIILLYRDPLDVLYSIILTWLKKELPLLINYKVDITQGLDELLKKRDSDNIMKIYYENLITNTESTVQDICSFIGVSFEKNMLEYKKIKNINYKIGDFNNLSKDSISGSSIFNWRNVNNYKHWRLLKDYLYLIGKEKYDKLGYEYEAAEKIIWEINKKLKKPLYSYSLDFLLSDALKKYEMIFHAKRKVKRIFS